MHHVHSHWANDPDIALAGSDLRYRYDLAHDLNPEQAEHEPLAPTCGYDTTGTR